MEFLNKEYEDIHAWRDKYKGYHVLPNTSAVENRFLKGDPLSCFCLDGRCNEVHVAFKIDEPEQSGDEREVTYLSLRYQTSKCVLTAQDCSFVDLFVLMRCHQL